MPANPSSEGILKCKAIAEEPTRPGTPGRSYGIGSRTVTSCVLVRRVASTWTRLTISEDAVHDVVTGQDALAELDRLGHRATVAGGLQERLADQRH